MSHNELQLELTATQGLTMGDSGASASNEIIEEGLDSAEGGGHRRNIIGLNMKDRDASTTTPIIDLLDSAKRGHDLRKQPPPSICKVSIELRNLSKESFNPQEVYIGPIHREDPELQVGCKSLKDCYLRDLLTRCRSPKETIFEACLQKVNGLILQIIDSYDGVIKNYTADQIASMMVMDGFFILEFCFKLKEKNVKFLSKRKTHRIAMDLILLENQVPFVVLRALFDCLADHMVERGGPFTLRHILDAYLAPYVNKLFKKNSTTDVVSNSTPHHLLGYLHKLYRLVSAEASKPVDEELAAKSSKPKWDASFHSIVNLDRSGMNFKPHQEDEWSMTIKFQSPGFSSLPLFWGKPTLRMPTLVIGDFTELIFRNFIAYEQSFPQADHYYFTSYAIAMDKLIDTPEDIAKLVESKVLRNELGSNQEAADMINKLCKNMVVKYFCYTGEFEQVDKYYNRFWPKHIAYLRREYFSNPWSIIKLLAAMIGFGLLVVSTIYAIKAVKK